MRTGSNYRHNVPIFKIEVLGVGLSVVIDEPTENTETHVLNSDIQAVGLEHPGESSTLNAEVSGPKTVPANTDIGPLLRKEGDASWIMRHMHSTAKNFEWFQYAGLDNEKADDFSKLLIDSIMRQDLGIIRQGYRSIILHDHELVYKIVPREHNYSHEVTLNDRIHKLSDSRGIAFACPNDYKSDFCEKLRNRANEMQQGGQIKLDGWDGLTDQVIVMPKMDMSLSDLVFCYDTSSATDEIWKKTASYRALPAHKQLRFNLSVAKALLQAVQDMHSLRIIHGNMTVGNVLISVQSFENCDFDLKLCDFGASQCIPTESESVLCKARASSIRSQYNILSNYRKNIEFETNLSDDYYGVYLMLSELIFNQASFIQPSHENHPTVHDILLSLWKAMDFVIRRDERATLSKSSEEFRKLRLDRAWIESLEIAGLQAKLTDLFASLQECLSEAFHYRGDEADKTEEKEVLFRKVIRKVDEFFEDVVNDEARRRAQHSTSLSSESL